MRITALLAALVLVVAACSSDDDDASPTTTQSSPATIATTTSTTVATTTTTVPEFGTVSTYALENGDCFDDADTQSTEPVEITEVVRVSCEDPHDNEVFAASDFVAPAPADDEATDGSTTTTGATSSTTTTTAPDPDAYPGEDSVKTFAESFCIDQFESFVGVAYADSVLTITTFWPTAETWDELEDRAILCVLFQRGEQLTGSAEGTEI